MQSGNAQVHEVGGGGGAYQRGGLKRGFMVKFFY